MGKKLFGMMGAAALMFAVSSCADDNKFDLGGQDGDLVEVTFTLTKEGTVSTRADGYQSPAGVYYPGTDEYPQISDGSKATRLIWAVYDKNGNILPELAPGFATNPSQDQDVTPGYGQAVEDITNFPYKIKLTLVRGQEYTFAFWAQDPNAKAFDTSNLEAVTVDYKSPDNKNNLNNDELRDAFCKVETFTVSSAESTQRDIILKRPFAQINVGITKEEYEAMQKSGVRISKSKVHLENVATVFNVVGNSTSDKAEDRQAIDFEYNWIPAYYNYLTDGDLTEIPTDGVLNNEKKEQYLKIDLDRDGTIKAYGQKNDEDKAETYKYLMMCYVLPADRNDGTSTYSTTLDKVEAFFQPEDEGQSPLRLALENVPIQRNWRTNIFGSLFTSEVNLIIDLDPFYSGDYNYPEWERIYEGVTYDSINDEILISNGAGLKWLADATNGVWPTAEAFEADNNFNSAAKNSSKLMLKATKEAVWPSKGLFRFKDVTIKLTADIDLAAFSQMFNNGEDFTPIGNDDAEIAFNAKLGYSDYSQTDEDGNLLKFFNGNLDGQNHTIYNLKVGPKDDPTDKSPYGLIGMLGRVGTVKNLRLKNVNVESHFHAGAIVGYIYSRIRGLEEDCVNISNCYVDGGTITSTSRLIGDNEYDDANNIGGIAGMMYNTANITDCFVRNLTIRGYRKIGGIVGSIAGDYPAMPIISGNKVYDVTIIYDHFQEYNDNKDFKMKNHFIGETTTDDLNYDGKGNTKAPGTNTSDNVKVYAFTHEIGSDGKKYTDIKTEGLLNNPPLEIFPRLARYTDIVRLQTSILGLPSAYKIYNTVGNNDEEVFKGLPDETSGRVGLWISGIILDGDTNGDEMQNGYLDNATVTASGVEGKNDCVVFIKDSGTLKNVTFHGAKYAGEAISLDPGQGKTITLENVLAYDAKKVLTDNGDGNQSTLDVKDSNFRGYVSLSKNYRTITFENTVFDGSTKIADQTTNKLEIADNQGKVVLEECTFLAPFVIEVPDGTKFIKCKAKVLGKDETEDVTESCIIGVDDNGNVVVK